jgi:RNA polymerase sigma-70 factor (ECF subfamily)
MQLTEFKSKVYPLRHRVFRLAKWILNNQEEAEDVAQEIMVRAWTMRDRLSGYKSIEAFLITMTRNLCLDRIKTTRKSTDITQLKIESSAPSQLEDVLAKELHAIIRTIIQSLPDQQRLVVQLRSIEELPFDEVSEITGLSINNVRVCLSRARKTIQERYLKYMADGK